MSETTGNAKVARITGNHAISKIAPTTAYSYTSMVLATSQNSMVNISVEVISRSTRFLFLKVVVSISISREDFLINIKVNKKQLKKY
jgi:hypothetical protein